MTDKEHSCQIFHFDLFGTRKEKYEFLDSHSLDDVEWTELHPQAPQYFFVPKDFSLREEYEKGFCIDELMKVNTNGVKTHNDKELISIEKFATNTNQRFYYRPFDNRWIDYDLSKVKRHRYSAQGDFSVDDPYGTPIRRFLQACT